MTESANRKIVARARRLRRNATDAEKRLWSELRGNGFADANFRRQTPIGAYIVDFVSFSQRLVIEVDGGHHGDSVQTAFDDERTQWLESQGFRVMRFWNTDVFDDLDAVLNVILQSLDIPFTVEKPSKPPHQAQQPHPSQKHPHPLPTTPSPARRERVGVRARGRAGPTNQTPITATNPVSDRRQ